jgi:hypothetical protein
VRPLGKEQLRLLSVLASPGVCMPAPCRVAESLKRRGLLRSTEGGGGAVIAPAGLRALADALEAGRVRTFDDYAREQRAINAEKYPHLARKA